MESDTALCNLAISHLGSSSEIANVETERSKEAAACRRFLSDTKREAFRDLKPPFATVIETLSLVEEDPNSEWSFSYRYPTDCSFFLRILSGTRNDSRQSAFRIRFQKTTRDY